MTDTHFQVARAAGFVAAVTFALVLQRLRPHAGADRSARVNVSLWITNLLVVAVLCGACGFTLARWAASADVGLLNRASVPSWLGALATVAGLDLVSYAWHRANHGIPFLWRFHQVHHSDPHYTVSTAARFHPGEIVLSLPVRLAAVVAMGASPLGVVVFEIVFATANYFEHGDIDLPLALERRLGRVLVVPALHLRHHSQTPNELNTNFATIFIVWDRLLGTYGDSASTDRYLIGLPGAGATASPLRLDQALRLPLGVATTPREDD